MKKVLLITGMVSVILAWILIPVLKASTPQSTDILMQVLGGTAGLAADGAYREADVYFHGGAMDECTGDEHKGHENHINDGVDASLPLASIIRNLQVQVAPKEDKHLAGEEEKEMLPWFIVAVRLNPHHVEAWRTGSYWIYRTGGHDKAIEFITNGIKNNQGDYRLYMDRGILHHRSKEWQKSVVDLTVAKRLWKNNSEDAPYDKRAIDTFMEDSLKHQDK
ncbi:MAG: tetratricopeptide repeat protein [Armatimonadota bacterium]